MILFFSPVVALKESLCIHMLNQETIIPLTKKIYSIYHSTFLFIIKLKSLHGLKCSRYHLCIKHQLHPWKTCCVLLQLLAAL